MSIEDFSEHKITDQLKKQQDLSYAIVGGATAAIVGAVIWAIITVLTGYQIGYMAIGLGFMVGIAVRFFGAGVDFIYQIVGAILALVGCMLGNLLSQVGFMANAESLGYFETMTYLNYDLIVQIYADTFNPMDLLFYGIAVYEGYRFSIRPASDEIIEEFNKTGKVSVQPYNHLRFPLVLGSFISIGIFAFFLSRGTSGHKTFTYDSGAKMSEGEFVQGKENGEWRYWAEAGYLQSTGNFKDGVEEGNWEWYNEENKVTRKGSYKDGLFDGIWLNYYPNGVASDSGNYIKGRMEGFWVSRYENGTISQTGIYLRDRPTGAWAYYYENGNLSTQGSYDKGVPVNRWKFWYANGKLKEEVDWISENVSKVVNSWDETGKQFVTNGNGTYLLKHDNGKIYQTGQIKDGNRIGQWMTYRYDGSKQEESEYKNGVYLLKNAWLEDGEQTITNGGGEYITYHPDEKTIQESGAVQNGLREGQWITYSSAGDTLQIANFKGGKLNGNQRYYFDGGLLYATGNILNDKREGEWNWFYESGGVESSVFFKEGKKEGVQIFWSESGKKSKEEHYKNDELISENLVSEN
jgi:antitoxin component YwqK of YwqJK toxin-antitoxin module